MARYAAGLKAWGYSDRSGFRYRLNDMLVEWNGLKVGPDEYEEKQPQLEPSKTTPDPEGLRNPRPDQRNEVLVERLLPLNPFETAVASGTNTNLTVYEPNHGRGSGSTVRFRSAAGVDGISKETIEAAAGYTITVVDANTYTVVVSGTVLVGNQRGGGGKATAGPVSLGV